MEKIRLFPTCELLILNIALTLEGFLLLKKGKPAKETDIYQEQINDLFLRASKSNDPNVRSQAQAQLISKFIAQNEYEKAQELIDQLPDAILVNKKQMQSNLFIANERYADAAKISEERLLLLATELHGILITLMECALKEHRDEDAKYIADISKATAQTLDQWEYSSYAAHFQLYSAKKERIKALKTFIKMIRALSKKWDLNSSPLYRHLKTKPVDKAFGSMMTGALLDSLKNDPEYTFLKTDEQDLTNDAQASCDVQEELTALKHELAILEKDLNQEDQDNTNL